MTKNVDEMGGDDDNEEYPLGFPIQDTDGSVHMKNIPLSFLPKFHGLRSEDPIASSTKMTGSTKIGKQGRGVVRNKG